MALVFRDHQVLVVTPESSKTQIQMGLSESLLPASMEIPTVVFRHKESGLFQTNPPADDARANVEEVRPLVRGEIADEAAFHYFLKMIYRSVVPAETLSLPPALYLVAPLSWNRRQVEKIVRYLFEEVRIPALAVSLQGVMAAYAYAASECLVIDVGYEKTEITVISNFEADRNASRSIPIGGNTINSELSAALPDLSETQIEDLKRSPIYEVLCSSEKAALVQADKDEADEENGVVNIAAIVSSGRTREILDRRERRKQGELTEVANADMQTNKFVDRDGIEHEIGSARFNGTEPLVAGIVDAVGEVLYRLKPRLQEQIFENVIIIGYGSKITGLTERIAEALEHRWVLSSPQDPATLPPDHPAASGHLPVETPHQGPKSFVLAKILDHFPEWKSQGAEGLGFLGAQIGAKQAFTTGMEGVFVARQDYNEVGPPCIWDIFQ